MHPHQSAFVTLKHIPLSVLPTQNLLVRLDEACSFISDSLCSEYDGSVLVHCLDGLNLAPSVAIAYLMQAKSLDYDTALAPVRAAKLNALPAPHFEDQLRIWGNIDYCIYEASGQEKLPYVLWKMSMKDAFKRQESELKVLGEEAKVCGGCGDQKKA